MSEVWYRISRWTFDEPAIEKVVAEKSTEKNIVFDGFMERKVSRPGLDDWDYFPTFQSAKSALVRRHEEKLSEAETQFDEFPARLKELTGRLNAAKGIEE